ncbi:DEAD/DEAH box helicase [Micromonospora sp. WMMD1076]|uniref:DEAD/DEAH box helicase n=1 Tax=Micromonospora sp. WMMD1076 TaxID=3016103 RepID=UPI00249A3817|nr:DEAD/DEAH box helicase [Micromonospora sp. WMMD1076]WFF08713.1 DEAD/DEAH box helicase [Micromonospora sp. WMMD1076]
MAEGPGFHGLFIGVNNYQHPSFRALSFARRDAGVLHALFSDTFGGNATLLLEGDATRDKILTELGRIESTSADSDIVVVTFSGHGTPAHELAPWDASPERPTETAIPFADFAGHLERITARVLIVVLDCCFSGGLLKTRIHQAEVTHQAKVLHQPDDGYTSRHATADADVDLLLSRVRGSGHFVFAASGPDEYAYEKAEFGHGVLTHYVIQALLGPASVLDGDGISMLSFADYVLRNVAWHRSGLLRRSQDARLGGSMSRVRIPVLRPGPRYAEIAGTPPLPATKALSSLHRHGIPDNVTTIWSSSIRQLNEVQLTTVNNAGLLRGEPVLVSAPTASGKTLVGELAAVRAKQAGKRSVFLLPSRAMVNEQYDRFRQMYEPLGITTVRATGELRDHLTHLLRGDYDFAVLTYEKFSGLLSRRPGLLHQIGVLVVDEIHTLFDPTRGPGLETLLTQIKHGRKSGTVPQLVGLSAVLGDPHGLAGWLGTELVTSRHRSVPLVENVIGPDGRCHSRRSDLDEPDAPDPQATPFIDPVHSGAKDDVLAALVTTLISRGQQVIVFRGTRDQARRTADRLADTLSLPPAEKTIAGLAGRDTGNTYDRLRRCLAGGVAFHTADLSERERRVVEQAYRESGSEVRVLVATTTLAQGVNLPADAVVICELTHPDGTDYTVSEYKNMAGRAGRAAENVPEGMAFVLVGGSADTTAKWQRYVLGEPDARWSALLAPAGNLGTLVLNVLSVIMANQGHCAEEDVRDFLAHTLAAHQAYLRHMPSPFPDDLVRATVEDLLDQSFLSRDHAGLALTRLGRIVVEHGLGIRSVRRIVDLLATVGLAELTDRTLLCVAQFVDELRDVRFIWSSANPQGDLDYLRNWLSESNVPHKVMAFTDRDPAEGAGNLRRAFASLSWTRGRPLAQIEHGMLSTVRKPGITGDPGPIVQAMRRAADVIAAVINIACHVHPEADLGDLWEVLPGSQELGILAEHVLIARKLDGDVDRGVFVALWEAGLTTVRSVRAADEDILLDCVGGDHDMLRRLLDAAKVAAEEKERPSLSDIVPPISD